MREERIEAILRARDVSKTLAEWGTSRQQKGDIALLIAAEAIAESSPDDIAGQLQLAREFSARLSYALRQFESTQPLADDLRH